MEGDIIASKFPIKAVVLVILALVVIVVVGVWGVKASTKPFTACSGDFCQSGDLYQVDQSTGCLALADKIDANGTSSVEVVAKFCGTEWKLNRN